MKVLIVPNYSRPDAVEGELTGVFIRRDESDDEGEDW